MKSEFLLFPTSPYFLGESWLILIMKSKLPLNFISASFYCTVCASIRPKCVSVKCETLKLFFSKQAHASYYHGVLAAMDLAFFDHIRAKKIFYDLKNFQVLP